MNLWWILFNNKIIHSRDGSFLFYIKVRNLCSRPTTPQNTEQTPKKKVDHDIKQFSYTSNQNIYTPFKLQKDNQNHDSYRKR